MNYKQIFEIKKRIENKLKTWNKDLTHTSGIYILTRITEEGKVNKYVGQAKDIMARMVSHMQGYKTKNPQHIDKSLKLHGLYSNENKNGWFISELIPCSVEELNEKEKYFIKLYERFCTHNITSGSQGKGKTDINERNLQKIKSYTNGKKYGYSKAIEQVKVFFEKYLDHSIKGQPNKIKERKLAEFEELLKGTIQNEDEKIDSEND